MFLYICTFHSTINYIFNGSNSLSKFLSTANFLFSYRLTLKLTRLSCRRVLFLFNNFYFSFSKFYHFSLSFYIIINRYTVVSFFFYHISWSYFLVHFNFQNTYLFFILLSFLRLLLGSPHFSYTYIIFIYIYIYNYVCLCFP